MERLRLAFEEYDITRALVHRYVAAPGLDLDVVLCASEERHERMFRDQEFDVCEFSMCQYLMAKDRGLARFTAIPVFPRRMFGQRFLLCRSDRGIEDARDLKGKRVAIFRYQNTLAFWTRGYLQHEHGISPDMIEWVRVRDEVLECPTPPGVSVRTASAGARTASAGATAEALLLAGEVDALVVPAVPKSFRERDPRIRRVFADVRRVETDYYRKTGDFPIMHTMVVRDDLLDRVPDVARAVTRAFEDAKQWYFDYASQPYRLGQAFAGLEREEEQTLLGPDPWPYTVHDNQVSLGSLLQYATEQGLVATPPRLERLFIRVEA